MLPFSEACERNKDPILGILRGAFADLSGVVEIGSGSGQHAVTSPGGCRTSTGNPLIAPKTCRRSPRASPSTARRTSARRSSST